MFEPIIHNLDKDDLHFELLESYNKLIDSKPTTGNLQQKIEAQRKWKIECLDLFDKIRSHAHILKGKNTHEGLEI